MLLEAELELDPLSLWVPPVAAQDVALTECILDKEVVVATARRQRTNDSRFPQPKAGKSRRRHTTHAPNTRACAIVG